MVLQKIQKDYMWFLLKHFSAIFLFFIYNIITAHTPRKVFTKEKLYLISDTNIYFKNIKIIPDFKEATQIALSYYPELKNVKIVFKYQKNNSPLSTRVAFFSYFQKKKNRKYIIIISNCTKPNLKFIQLNNLSLNAQVGVLGHELAHVSTFKNKSFLYFLKLAFNHLFVNSIDKYEYETDYKTIQHRLGY